MVGNRNAQIGSIYERKFAELLQSNRLLYEKIVSACKSESHMLATNTPNYDVAVVGNLGKKTDVVIRDTNGNHVGASVKAYSGNGFNQITRMSIENFVKLFGVSDDVYKILKVSTIRKARKLSSKWISDKDVDLVVQEFERLASDIIEVSLLGEDRPQLLVLAESSLHQVRVFLMEELIEKIKTELGVRITPRGVISLHPCISVQKKGGNGRHEKYPKDDLRHGGNNIQVKAKPALLAKLIEPITAIDLQKNIECVDKSD